VSPRVSPFARGELPGHAPRTGGVFRIRRPVGSFAPHLYLTESVGKVVLQRSVSAQIRQFIRYISDKLTNLCKN
jgi:hypothetical protein